MTTLAADYTRCIAARNHSPLEVMIACSVESDVVHIRRPLVMTARSLLLDCLDSLCRRLESHLRVFEDCYLYARSPVACEQMFRLVHTFTRLRLERVHS